MKKAESETVIMRILADFKSASLERLSFEGDFSYGISEWKSNDDTVKDCVARADSLMYDMKKRRKALE